MSRFVSEAIAERNARGRAALIGYLPLGFPDLRGSIEAAIAVLQSGVDAIELGLPYSDPVMDGPVIQAATRQALASGIRTADVFEAVAAIRARVDAPVLVMGYVNPIEQYGIERFASDLADAGGAGLVTPDLTPDNASEWIDASTRHGLERVFLAAPSSTPARLERVAQATNGFIYASSTMGVTGTRQHLSDEAERLVSRIREVHQGHVCVGIGISTPEHVTDVARYANGAIVGSALVHTLSTEGLSATAHLAAQLSDGTTVRDRPTMC